MLHLHKRWEDFTDHQRIELAKAFNVALGVREGIKVIREQLCSATEQGRKDMEEFNRKLLVLKRDHEETMKAVKEDYNQRLTAIEKRMEKLFAGFFERAFPENTHAARDALMKDLKELGVSITYLGNGSPR